MRQGAPPPHSHHEVVFFSGVTFLGSTGEKRPGTLLWGPRSPPEVLLGCRPVPDSPAPFCSPSLGKEFLPGRRALTSGDCSPSPAPDSLPTTSLLTAALGSLRFCPPSSLYSPSPSELLQVTVCLCPMLPPLHFLPVSPLLEALG